MIVQGYVFSVAYGLFCLLLGMISHKAGLPKRYSRKIVHILVGFEWLILYHFMGTSYHFLVVCLLFTALLCLVYFKRLLPMMQSDGDNDPGTVYYGVAMSLLAALTIFVPKLVLPFGIGVFATSFGDGFAGLVGQLITRYNPKIYYKKSLFGALTSFAVTFLVALTFKFTFDMELNIFHCFALAFLCAVIELISTRGLDNIFITVFVTLAAFLFINLPTINYYIVPILATPVIIALVTKKQILTRLGLVFAIILDLVISLTLGNFGLVLLMSFLFGSVLIDKLKAKGKREDIAKKGHCRDHIQVIANGLIPMFSALVYSITENRAYLVAFVAVLAEAFADTAASGVGVFSKTTFDPFRMKKCECGISGGVSFLGTFAALLGSFLFPVIAVLFGAIDLKMYLIAALVAFLGVIFDSMLGSLVQVKFCCAVCGKITEKEVHCATRAEKHSGYAFFDNDVVNLASGLTSAILAVVFTSLII